MAVKHDECLLQEHEWFLESIKQITASLDVLTKRVNRLVKLSIGAVVVVLLLDFIIALRVVWK